MLLGRFAFEERPRKLHHPAYNRRMVEKAVNGNRRVLLLMKASTYRAPDFMAAAEQLGIDVVRVVDTPQAIAPSGQQREGLLSLDFSDVEAATRDLVAFAREQPVRAILAVDDSGSLLAARASAALGLPHNAPQAAEAARDKYRMRTLMARAGIDVPRFRRFTTADDARQVAQEVSYPCVLKPLRLSGSQGVMRADDAPALEAAIDRLSRLLQTLYGSSDPLPYLVEDYLPGVEVALEGMLDRGQLHVLALFDKPDPLEGPFFEETIYVTPSRLPAGTQDLIARTTAEAAQALGLERGPVHAELRVNERGAWLLEIAGRSIGGLCARTLQFGVDTSLETLILRQAMGLALGDMKREQEARGVMMIPIPGEGLLKGVEGVGQAEAVEGVSEVEITAPLNNMLKTLPEGDSYLGFIFARGATPEAVEAALRKAHGQLRFEVAPVMELTMKATG